MAKHGSDCCHGQLFARVRAAAIADRWRERKDGAVAQLGEHLLCKQGVVGSIPSGSTTLRSSSFGWQATRRSLDEGVSTEALAQVDGQMAAGVQEVHKTVEVRIFW